MPICRAYAKAQKPNSPPSRILLGLWRLYFRAIHSYWPSFERPRSFSEKVWHRMIYDRSPLWPVMLDKLESRRLIADLVGEDYLIPLLWAGELPESLPFASLPNEFVIKATHGCGYNIIVTDKRRLNCRAVIAQLKKWQRENYCNDHLLGMEWGYKPIVPRLIVEPLLGAGNNNLPADYKFLCFAGRAEVIQVDRCRHTPRHTKTFYNREFQRLELNHGISIDYAGTPPGRFGDMLRIAECISRTFDFIRVDMYSVGDSIYCGELTPYPGGGIVKFRPTSVDFDWGERWGANVIDFPEGASDKRLAG
jgi:hypothetical protein